MEFKDVDLGDERLNRRLAQVAEALLDHPQDSINTASQNWADAKAAYRFFDNEKVEPEKILSAHRGRTVERIAKSSPVLAIQDTSFLTYNNLEIEGLGRIGGSSKIGNPCKGFLIHTVLAVDPGAHEHGLPLGILHQKIWTRKKVRDPKKPTGKESRESMKWTESMLATRPNGEVQVVHVADREADITDFLQKTLEDGQDFLVRACRDRILTGQEVHLWEHMQSQPVLFEYEVEVSTDEKRLWLYDKAKKLATKRLTAIPARQATTEARLGRVTLQNKNGAPIDLYAVYVKEKNPPNELVALEWMLLTSVETKTAEQVKERIQWYKMRWHIENFHRMLKSGCRTEDCRMETAERLKRYIALNSVIAWRLYWMSRVGRVDQKVSCEAVLAPHEWQALYAKTHKKKPPKKPPTLAETMLWIGKLGGFLGRRNDGHPGVKAMWKGWQRLTDLANGWLIFQQLNNCG